MGRIATGLDRFREEYWKHLKGARLGLLSNQASLDGQLKSAKEIIEQVLPGRLKALFGPQHGHEGGEQDNMVETDHSYDEELALPVFSLYSKEREPVPEMLELIDVLMIDLQDVGTRVYTFASTMLECLKAAGRSGKKVLVLDRPNPLGGEIVEGNLLRPEFTSFVGPFSLPMRHALTMAEMAQIFNDEFKLGADLDVLPMKGWHRHMLWQDTGLRWIMPSPNMPLPETAQVYPGQVIWEGTNLSEGRGTCRPFEIFGAPYLNIKWTKQGVDLEAMRGCTLQEISFRPTFHKWEGDLCRGFMIHILDPHTYRPLSTTLAFLKAIIERHGGQFQWRNPPYEYEYEKMPVDLILGNGSLRMELEKGLDLLRTQEIWEGELKHFLEWRKPYLIYR
ncbi:MAG: DUF1343 domain-containing protein [Pseudomonadota bacterium]